MEPGRGFSWKDIGRAAGLLIFVGAAGLLTAYAFGWMAGQAGIRDMEGLRAWVGGLRDAVFSLVQIVGALLLCTLVWVVGRWLSGGGEGIVILPFENATGQEGYSGTAVSDSLIAELHRILRIHTRAIEGTAIQSEKLSLPALAPGRESLAESLSEVGTIGVGETKVSVGRLLVSLKRLWPFGEPGSVMAGSLQRYGSRMRLVARMEERGGVRAWEVTDEITGADRLPELVRDLAFEIVLALSEGSVRAKTRGGFRHFTEALEAFGRYQKTKSRQELEWSRTNCLAAVRSEPGYEILYELFYNLGISFFIDMKDYGKAEEMFRQATLLKPDNAYALNGLGASLAGQNRHDEAAESYREALKIDPEFSTPRSNLSLALLGQKRYEEAAEACQEALDLNDGDAFAWSAMGDILRAQKKYEEAADAYEKALERDSTLASARNGLGNLHSDLKRYDDAIQAYKEATLLDPKFAHPWNNLGNIYSNQGRHEEAARAFEKAISLDLKFASPWSGLGGLLRQQGRMKEAEDACRKATLLDPKLAEPWSNLGYLYRDRERYEEAIEAFEKACRLDPEMGPARAGLAVCSRKLGRSKDYERHLGIARALMEKEDEYNRACFEALCGNQEEALKLLAEALEKKIVSPAWAAKDSDFESLREDPGFLKLVGGGG